MQNFEATEMLQTMCYLPDQCTDPWEKRWKAYDDRNGLQEDPYYDEKARRAIKAWTDKEKELASDQTTDQKMALASDQQWERTRAMERA